MGIKLEKVCKAYGGQHILHEFSLELPQEGVVCLFGPSGCGKTTLLNCIAKLESVDSGKIIGVPDKVSCVFQEDRLLPWVSAEENIAAVLPKEKYAQAQKWLEYVGLKDAKNKYPAELSGGMRQRVAIARAMAYNGEAYLLDEPFHALDEESKMKIISLLQEKTPHTLKLFVTHDRGEAELFADQIYLLSGPPLHVDRIIFATDFVEK